MTTIVNMFITDDLTLAAFIIARQALRLSKVSMKGEFGCFHFLDPHRRGDALAQELAEGGQAPALLFQQTIRTLKRQTLQLANSQTARKFNVQAEVR